MCLLVLHAACCSVAPFVVGRLMTFAVFAAKVRAGTVTMRMGITVASLSARYRMVLADGLTPAPSLVVPLIMAVHCEASVVSRLLRHLEAARQRRHGSRYHG